MTTLDKLMQLRPQEEAKAYGTGRRRKLLQVSYPDPAGGGRKRLNVSYPDDEFLRALDALVRRHARSTRSGMVRSATMRLARELGVRKSPDLRTQLLEIGATYGLDMSKTARWAVHAFDVLEPGE